MGGETQGRREEKTGIQAIKKNDFTTNWQAYSVKGTKKRLTNKTENWMDIISIPSQVKIGGTPA